MTDTPEVMVLEENAAMRNFLCASVTSAACAAVVAGRAQDAIRRFRAARPDVVILSLGATRSTRMLRTISILHAIDPEVPIIVISGHARASLIAQALDRGATDFVTAPFDEADVTAAVAKALNGRGRSVRVSPRHMRDDRETKPRLVGTSAAMATVREFVDRAGATDLTVLIRGESGTGKMLVAREIVAASSRWNQPFVKVNCATARHDIESDLLALGTAGFGGALTDLDGKFAWANNGTLFFDEIGLMSPAMQSTLLKLLQDRESTHLGRRTPGLPDVRLIAATSRDLEREVAQGRFREELFFRLNVLSIQLPPLRERRGDIPELADHFLALYASQYHASPERLPPAMMQQLIEHEWTGNVRELQNLVRRIVLLGAEAAVADEFPPLRPWPPNDAGAPAAPVCDTDAVWNVSLKEHARMAAREAERALILRTLEQTHWNRKEAASLLRISYKALLKKLRAWKPQNSRDH